MFFTLLTMYWTLLVAIGIKVRPQDFDLQVLFYLIFSVLIIPGLWIISFKRTPLTVKLIYSILFITYFFTPKIFPSVLTQFSIDSCLDRGGCWDSAKNKCEIWDQKKCTEIKSNNP